MFQTAFLIIFSLSLLIANIYCFVNKQYLYLFIPCMLFLPDFYGIGFSTTLPVLTVARMMFLIFYLYAWINRRKTPSFKYINFKVLPKAYYFLGGYFVLRIFSNLYYITTYGQAAKTIFEIIFEQLFLLGAIWMLAPTKEEIDKLIKIVVWVAAVMFILGILESLTGFRIVDALHTVHRNMLNEHYIRLGLLRSTVTMGLPGFYGNMCLLILPLIFYMYEITKSKFYLVVTFFDIWAMIHSGCRSDIFFFIFIMAIYVIFVLKGKKRRTEFINNACKVCAALLLTMTLLSISSPYYKYFYLGTGKSVLNEVGFDFDLNEGAPKDIEGYGSNSHGANSRIFQLSGIYYALSTNPLSGLGNGALSRGDVKYYSYDAWRVNKAVDLGFVEVLILEGLFGFVGYCFIFIFIIRLSFALCFHTNFVSINTVPLLSFTYLVCMLSTANMPHFLFFIIIINIVHTHFLHNNNL